MILTLEDAKTKWCPWARVTRYGESADNGAPEGPASANRTDEGEGGGRAYCLADGCMAWRWDIVGWKKVQVPAPDDSICLEDSMEPIYSSTHGYCGAGGKP
jgi:hypothetical protein